MTKPPDAAKAVDRGTPPMQRVSVDMGTGTARMIWRGHLDLPAELAGILPPLFTQAIVAFAGIGVAVGLRIALDQIVPGVVPFALTFPVIAAVTLLAGTRAGVIALIGCQLLIWYAILPPPRSFAIESSTVAANLVLVTGAQALLLWAVASYRKLMAGLMREDRQRIDDLSLALREIDHRTKNNFHLAIGLLEIQARNTGDAGLKSALNRAAARMQAISGVYKNLALSSADLEAVRLHDYLAEICERLRDGLLSPAIVLKLETEPVTVPHELAIRVGLIVNELVTNATKHAFPEGIGTIMIKLEKPGDDALRLIVSDDGKGLGNEAGSSDGLGSKLIAMLVRQLGAALEVESNPGTTHRLTVPLPGNQKG